MDSLHKVSFPDILAGAASLRRMHINPSQAFVLMDFLSRRRKMSGRNMSLGIEGPVGFQAVVHEERSGGLTIAFS